MAYCSITAIYTALPLLPNTTTADGYSETANIINLHIRRTDGLVNGKCARRYVLPFTSTAVPPFIRTIAEDIVCYYTYRSLITQDSQNKTEYLEELKENAMANLDAVMNGDIDLVDTNGSAVPVLTEELEDHVSSNTQDYQPFFDIDSDLKWKFDDDLEDSVRSGRS